MPLAHEGKQGRHRSTRASSALCREALLHHGVLLRPARKPPSRVRAAAGARPGCREADREAETPAAIGELQSLEIAPQGRQRNSAVRRAPARETNAKRRSFGRLGTRWRLRKVHLERSVEAEEDGSPIAKPVLLAKLLEQARADGGGR